MNEAQRYQERKAAIHLLRSGKRPSEVARVLQRSVTWVCKWRDRWQAEGWAGLGSRSRVPSRSPSRLPAHVRQAICHARSDLEARAVEGQGLRYIGAHAVAAHLSAQGLRPVPSLSSIQRVLRQAGMTRAKQTPPAPPMTYPRLHPSQPHQLLQVDILPRYLPGGQKVACFNAIDVVSRYPTGQASAQRRSQDAARFLLHTWRTMGVPTYTQTDNEGCFSGGATHPAVLGRVVRLALAVGTQLVFSPPYHPQSNGTIERFHQDYAANVWAATTLHTVEDVQVRADSFFSDYRQSRHHSALDGQSPAECHCHIPQRALPTHLTLTEGRRALHAGQVHFMRPVAPEGTVSVLNLTWDVPLSLVGKGVWVTLSLTPRQAALRVYDQPPDAPRRPCLATHPFPLQEVVQPQPVTAFSHPLDQSA
jgi:putative transposase